MFEDFLRVLIRAIVVAIISVVSLIVIIRVLSRSPGIIIALSMIAIGVFSVALYRGSFSAVGLHTKRSIRIAIIISSCLFVLSVAVLVFGFILR